MILQTLNGDWQFRQCGTENWLPAQVPGGVHTDLLAAGRIPDPFWGDNEKQVQWVAEKNWEYRRNFKVEPDLTREERIYLVFEGLDTLAEVRLNGRILGQADNMFRRYRWEVKSLLQPGENELAIQFSSPVAFARTRNQARPLPEMGDWLRGGSHMRKAPCHFGWDWGPRLPCIGIWKNVSLFGFSLARLEDVHLRQQHTDEGVILTTSVRGETWGEAEFQLQVRITAPDGEVFQAETAGESPNQSLSITIPNPQLWWPNGYGSQPLYQVEVLLFASEALLDHREYQLGLRSLELRQQADAWGRSFTFVVNGVPIFCKGSNWIPVDAFPTRVTAVQLEHLIRSAAEVHQNMLRVWGGGYYEDDYFYNLCDRYGLLVWQDFMFACAIYPWDDEAWLANVKREVIENTRRLRHHACLALWCGNNEIELLWDFFKLSKGGVTADLERAYERFYYHLLPHWLAREDPDHAYWPSSPASGDPFRNPNGEPAGDAHYWDVWHLLKPAHSYRQKQVRFVSEFGFEALPALQTIAGFATPKVHGFDSWRSLNMPLVKHHQRGAGGNAKIIYYLTRRFRLPKEFASLVYLSQVMQAEGVRIGVEHWRRKRERCSGALYWQLNDCWPAISWSSIDYYGHWKALHYAARRFFAPVLLSLEAEGNRVGMYVTNDGVQVWQGRLSWSLETMEGEVLVSGREMVYAHPLATSRICVQELALHFKKHDRTRLALICALWQGEQCVSSQVLPLAPEKSLRSNQPGITMEVKQEGEQVAITCRARSLARFVELSLDGAQPLFSDNFFDLPPDRPVTVHCPLPDGWTLERARAALRVRSLADCGDYYSLLYSNFIHLAAGMQALLQSLYVNLAALINH